MLFKIKYKEEKYMIEFNGYLTGASEKFFFKKYVTYMQNAFIFGLVMVLPLIFMLMRTFQTFSIFYGYCAVFAYAMIAVRIKTPKGRKEITPKRIYVIDNNLICISDKQSESRGVELVKTAYDYGEFYFLSFPMGKKSGNFVCQKDLLTQGTLEEFEKLFDGKIVRKY